MTLPSVFLFLFVALGPKAVRPQIEDFAALTAEYLELLADAEAVSGNVQIWKGGQVKYNQAGPLQSRP